MKIAVSASRLQVFSAGFGLSVLLAACGVPATPSLPPFPVPVLSRTYNPAASLTQVQTGSVPYHGDWVMVAQLMSGPASSAAVTDTRYGVASVNVDASSATFVNAGGGVLGWCRATTCTSNDETGTAVVGSVNVSGQAALSFGMVPRNSGSPRFLMTDDDGLVDVISGSPVIAGMGVWTENGKDVPARLTFVQTSSEASALALALGSASPANEAAFLHALQVSGASFAHARETQASETQARNAAARSALQSLPQN